MEVTVKFNNEEIKILLKALRAGIHCMDSDLQDEEKLREIISDLESVSSINNG